MSYFLFVLVVASFIGLSLVGLSFLIRFAGCLSLEKMTPFECGFDPKSSARIPFSLRFFLLAVLFLVFDVEVVLLFPLPLFGNYGVFSVVLVGCLVVLILFFGLLYEWWEGALDWA